MAEGPWVVESTHFKQYYQASNKAYTYGDISKKYKGHDILTERNPHTAAATLNVKYTGHKVSDQRFLAIPIVTGKLTYAGVTKEIVMTGDLIVPNIAHPICIPDERHINPKYQLTSLATTWFRIDAKTAGLNFTGAGKPGDRYFHLGSASAGCFTNVFAGGNDREWNAIAQKLSTARAGIDQLYVGHITFDIPKAAYDDIKNDLIARVKRYRLNGYVWENGIQRV